MAEKRAALQTQKQQTGTDLYSTALEDYRTRNNLGFADAMDSRSDELNRQKVTVSPAEKMEQNAKDERKGIGLRYVQMTLKSFYGEEAEMKIESELGKGTEVTLHFPVLPA